MTAPIESGLYLYLDGKAWRVDEGVTEKAAVLAAEALMRGGIHGLRRLFSLPTSEAWDVHTLDVEARYGSDETWWECGCGLRLTDPIRDEYGIGIPEASELHLAHLLALLSGDTQ